MTTDPETPLAHRHRRTIVVGVDGSAQARPALRWAADEAVLRGASLRIVHASAGAPAAPPSVARPGESGPVARPGESGPVARPGESGPVARPGESGPVARPGESGLPAAAVIDEAVALVAARHPGLAVQTDLLDMPAARALEGASGEADLLVVGARGRGGFAGLLLGSVSRHCIRHARCSVAVVRADPGDPSPPGPRIVVGVDGSAGSDGALRWALQEASRRSAVVEAVHAWQFPPVGAFVAAPPGGSETAAAGVVRATRALAARWEPGVPLEVSSRYGPTVPELLRASEHADLLVLGARGRGVLHEVLVGSVGQQCANHSPCPLVVVRDPPRSAAPAGPGGRDAGAAVTPGPGPDAGAAGRGDVTRAV